MSPILGARGGLAASAYGLFSPSLATNSYESIATTLVGSGGTTSVIFDNIPQTYKHLQLRIMQMTSGTVDPRMRFNADTDINNYRMHSFYNNNPNVSFYGVGNMYIPFLYNESTQPGVAVIDILDYSDTNKNTTVRDLSGYDANGTGYIFYRSGAWFNTAAVTKIDLHNITFAQNSHFALYGIKG